MVVGFVDVDVEMFFFLMMLKCFVVDFERLPNLPYEIGKY